MTNRQTINLDPEIMSLIFGGDTSLGQSYLTAEKWPAEHLRLQDDPQSFFSGVADLFGKHERAILNFESVLLEKRDAAIPLDKDFPGWDDPKLLLPVLKQLRVIAVNLANNHTNDFGPQHLLETKARFLSAGISTFGAGDNAEDASRALMVTHGKISFYILGAMKYRRRYDEELDYFAGKMKPGIALLDEAVLATIRGIRKDDPESIIIVSPHWSRNYVWPGIEEHEWSQMIIQAGADIVLAHGTHMLGGCSASNSGIQLLSIGNFVFNSPGRYKKHGAPPISLAVRMPLDEQLTRQNIRLELYPIVSDNRRTAFRPRFTTRSECEDVCALLKAISRNATSFANPIEMETGGVAPHMVLRTRGIKAARGTSTAKEN